MPLVVRRGVRSNVPVLLYVVATLVAAALCRRFIDARGALRDPIFWSAFSLTYLGPLAVLTSRQLGLSATFAGLACLCAGVVSLVLILRAPATTDAPVTGATGPRIAFVALGFSLFLGSIVSGTITTSYYRDAPTYFALLIAGFLVGRPDIARRFLGGTLCAILATCVGSLTLYLASPELVTTNFTSLTSPLLHAGRLTGPFGHPNAIGSLSAIGAALSLALAPGKLRYVAYGLCLATVFLSDQRSAVIAALTCGIIHLALPAQHTALTWLRTNLLVLGATALLFTNVIYDNLNDILNRREASVESRQQIYDYVLSHVHEVLPFGIGINGLYDRTHGILSRDGFSHAHNAWLSFLVAGGIIGGICFIALTILALVKSVQCRDRRQFVPTITVMILCIAESPTYAGSNWTIISVATVSILALVTPLTSRQHDKPKTPPPFGRRPAKAVDGIK